MHRPPGVVFCFPIRCRSLSLSLSLSLSIYNWVSFFGMQPDTISVFNLGSSLYATWCDFIFQFLNCLVRNLMKFISLFGYLLVRNLMRIHIPNSGRIWHTTVCDFKDTMSNELFFRDLLE